MRKGNKTRLLIALLTLALTVSGTAFARIDEVETDLGFADVPNAIEEVELAQEAGRWGWQHCVQRRGGCSHPRRQPLIQLRLRGRSRQKRLSPTGERYFYMASQVHGQQALRLFRLVEGRRPV